LHKLEWEQAGFFVALWQAGLAEHEEMEGIAWRWQSFDVALLKAPPAGSQSGPTRPTGEKTEARERCC